MELRVQIDEPWQKESTEAVARRFEGSHPGVRVHVDVVPNGEIRSALLQGVSNADILQLFNEDLVASGLEGMLLDLSLWLEENKELAVNFHPAILRLTQAENRIFALPLSATMKGIFYNKQWFEKAGIPYPQDDWTWDDFLETAIRLQHSIVSPGDERYAVRISFHWEYIGLLLLTAGTDWLSPDHKRASGYANSEQAVRAVTWAQDLVRKHKVARATQEYFSNGDLLRNETGMMLDYYIMLHELQPELKDHLGIAGLPYFRHGRKVNEPWICGFGITRKTDHPELAWSLLRELVCTNNELTREVTTGFIAPLRSVYADVAHDRDPMRNAVLAEMENNGRLPRSPGNPLYNKLDEYVNPALARIVFDGADVKETLDELAEQLDKQLSKEG